MYVACSELEPMVHDKACGLNIICSVQGSADISYIPFRGFTFCILCPSARVGCLQYKVSKTFLANIHICTYSIFDILLNRGMIMCEWEYPVMGQRK